MTIRCPDCFLAYSNPRFADFVIPDEAYAKIAPNGEMLCVECMLYRATVLGVTCEGRFTSGPFADHHWTKPT